MHRIESGPAKGGATFVLSGSAYFVFRYKVLRTEKISCGGMLRFLAFCKGLG